MLNSVDLRDVWRDLDALETELNEEARALEGVWSALCDLDSDNSIAHADIVAADELTFLPPDSMLRIEVGGQCFVLGVDLLTKDPFSLLAVCCRMKPPFALIDGDCVRFDRDWWLFRHIVTFLRTGLLPDEIDTLTELYTEACFYRLDTMKKAIEDVPVAKVQPKLPLQKDRYTR